MTAGPCSAAMDVGEQRNGAQRTDAPYLGKKEGPACAGPVFFGISIRSETGYCQHGKSRS
jgi:hypothetical protein